MNHISPLSKLSDEDVVRLVESGKKPVCSVNTRVKTHLPYLYVDRPIPVEDCGNFRTFIHYREETKASAKRVKELLNIEEWGAAEDREFGLLMGYDPEDVDSWIKEYHGDKV